MELPEKKIRKTDFFSYYSKKYIFAFKLWKAARASAARNILLVRPFLRKKWGGKYHTYIIIPRNSRNVVVSIYIPELSSQNTC